MAGCGAINLYLAWLEARGNARARMFNRILFAGRTLRPAPPPARCAPISRSAAAVTRVEITQGVEMGRPSRLLAEMEGDRPRVSGASCR